MRKNIVLKSIFGFSTFMLFMANAHAAELDFCVQTSAIWQLVGYAILILKILVPIVIIIFGIIDFAKAVVNEKDDNISTAAGMLLRRILIGIFILFIPTIVSMIFNAIAASSEAMQAGEACNICLTSPRDSACESYKATAKANRSF